MDRGFPLNSEQTVSHDVATTAHDRSREWIFYCQMARSGVNQRQQQLEVYSPSTSKYRISDSPASIIVDLSPLGQIKNRDRITNRVVPLDQKGGEVNSWRTISRDLSFSIDEVSSMIQRKSLAYVSSADNLIVCFWGGEIDFGNGTGNLMADADRLILETTVASFVTRTVEQIESLKKAAFVPNDHPFLQNISSGADFSENHLAKSLSCACDSDIVNHRAGVVSCLMQRLKSEIIDPMMYLQTQKKLSAKSLGRRGHGSSALKASDIVRSPLEIFDPNDSRYTHDGKLPFPPATWESCKGHQSMDHGWLKANGIEEHHEFLDKYDGDNIERRKAWVPATSHKPINAKLSSNSFEELLELPTTKLKEKRTILGSTNQTTNPKHLNLRPEESCQPTPRKESISFVQTPQNESGTWLEKESIQLLASYQQIDLEEVQRVEESMVEISLMLSRFTDLVSEQQEDIVLIHDQAMKSKDNVSKGQGQLIDAAHRGQKSRHPLAVFIFLMGLALLFFNWVIP